MLAPKGSLAFTQLILLEQVFEKKLFSVESCENNSFPPILVHSLVTCFSHLLFNEIPLSKYFAYCNLSLPGIMYYFGTPVTISSH